MRPTNLISLLSLQIFMISFSTIQAENRADLKLPNERDLAAGNNGGGNEGGNGDSGGGGSSAICLYQSDFDQGTKIITEPGRYKLCENISFYPLVNPPETASDGAANAFEPIFPGPYDENAFGLGFFAALCIAASDVKLDLNGYTIEQSEEHALLQRFFAVIELADSPFIPGVGPADFVGSNQFRTASRIKITGPGKIGRSSHHGIHGNDNSDVRITDVTFEDFEVAATSLNNVDNLLIEGCDIIQNRHNVPILGMFSAAKFIRPYGKILKDIGYTMNLRGVSTTAAAVYENLVNSINNAYDDILLYGEIDKNEHSAEYELYHNEFGVVDGPCYAFVVHGKGPAVGDFGFEIDGDASLTSSSIVIRNNDIRRIKCWTNEVPATIESDKVMNDARGAVFQLVRSLDKAPIARNNDGTYKGNAVADMQIMVAKAINDGELPSSPHLQTFVNSLDSTIISWASSGSDTYTPKYRCNGDSMHHVSKGITVIRVEDTVGFEINDNVIRNVKNMSPAAFDDCAEYHKGANIENAEDEESLQQGSNIRGISVGAVTGYSFTQSSSISRNRIHNFKSTNANVIVGLDIQGKSESISVRRNTINLKDGVGTQTNDAYVAMRVRKYSDVQDDDIRIKNNNFSQELETMNVAITTVEGCPRSRKKKNEWKVGGNPGGCPFGYKKNK